MSCWWCGFSYKHEKELENIEKAKGVVVNYHKSGPGYGLGDSFHREAPPPYFPKDPNTAPPQGAFDNSYPEQHFGGYGQQTAYSKA